MGQGWQGDAKIVEFRPVNPFSRRIGKNVVLMIRSSLCGSKCVAG